MSSLRLARALSVRAIRTSRRRHELPPGRRWARLPRGGPARRLRRWVELIRPA
ncbi:hypothetical protein [Salinispora cortesiana]|uniref:hypothetical protein n=1 Tax=Salinispora cortesiana TaxID=1305843 RepID=UPI0012BD0327|nr:hypothetical protein [Salinispora cortesiana]